MGCCALTPLRPTALTLNDMKNEIAKSSKETRRRRPLLISILSLLLMLSFISSLVGLVIPSQRAVIYPDGLLSFWGGFALLCTAMLLAATIGYWLMQSWGVYIFASYMLIGFIQQHILGMPATLEKAMIQIGGSTIIITMLSLLYGAIYLVLGYFYIIKPQTSK